jgi:hypothetical protein
MIWHLVIQFLNDIWGTIWETYSKRGVEVWIGRSDSGVKTETLQLIKQAAYELQIGPCEILQPLEYPSTFEVRFKSCTGAEQHVFLPINSNYALIEDAMIVADAS